LFKNGLLAILLNDNNTIIFNIMAEKKNRIEIPDFIVKQDDRKKFVETFNRKLLICGNAYKSLVAMPDMEEIPDNLQDINAKAVEKFINERLTEISKTKMLTSEKKKEAKEDWEKVKKDALSYIGTIKEFLATYPDADITIKDGIVVCTNFDDVVIENCKVKTPDGVTEWANLILDAKESIDALQKYEGEHGLPTGTLISLNESIKLLANPTSLVEAWLFMEWRKDYISKHTYLKGAYETGVKRSLTEQNERLAEMRKKHFEEHPEDFMPLGNKTSPYENQRGSLDSRDYSIEMK